MLTKATGADVEHCSAGLSPRTSQRPNEDAVARDDRTVNRPRWEKSVGKFARWAKLSDRNARWIVAHCSSMRMSMPRKKKRRTSINHPQVKQQMLLEFWISNADLNIDRR